MDKECLDQEICRAFQHFKTEGLKIRDFRELTGIPLKKVLKHYDSWAEACKANGGNCGPTGRKNLKLPVSYSKEFCEKELKRVAELIHPKKLTLSAFKAHASISERAIYRLWGNFKAAARAVGVEISDRSSATESLPLAKLAGDFLRVVQELGKVPTLTQLSRRATHSQHCYSEKFGGYGAFKQQAILHLLSSGVPSERIRPMLVAELERIDPTNGQQKAQVRPHQHGRMLGFRAFAYVPTYENEVVAMFGNVADELGFQIVTTRNEFPDCKALRRVPNSRRDRWDECIIEFELNSSDFKKHKHPADGCDLIVCWEHDWQDCPVKTLELKSTIQNLPGWQGS